MHPAFAQSDHRPWPLPRGRWFMRQSWQDLLFAHWPIPTADLRRFVPDGLQLQEYDGTSWISVVPFRMSGVTARWLPAIPGLSAFPELNVRLYVERDGKPGVWFLSLDATNPLAVWVARRWFHLPYQHATMRLQEDANGITFDSRRKWSVHPASFHAWYRPTAAPVLVPPGTLDAFLTERYCLYAQSPRGTLYRCEIHHLPWPIQSAEAELDATALLASHGLTVSGPPRLQFVRRLDVVVWPLERIDG
ncbi:MAG: DUF2071 domain-containing protein [Bacteroidales bacterium]|nr:DUF2071 domain-containing protein [Bacteroidales bacterium]